MKANDHETGPQTPRAENIEAQAHDARLPEIAKEVSLRACGFSCNDFEPLPPVTVSPRAESVPPPPSSALADDYATELRGPLAVEAPPELVEHLAKHVREQGCCGEDVDARARVAARARATAKREEGWERDPARLLKPSEADAARAARLFDSRADVERIMARWRAAVAVVQREPGRRRREDRPGLEWRFLDALTGVVALGLHMGEDIHAESPFDHWIGGFAIMLRQWATGAGAPRDPADAWERALWDAADVLDGGACWADGERELAASHWMAAGWVPARWLEGGAG